MGRRRTYRYDSPQTLEDVSVIPTVQKLPHLSTIQGPSTGAGAHVAGSLGGIEGQLSR